MIAQLKASGDWYNIYSEEYRRVFEEMPKYFGSLVNANPNNIDKAIASIKDGYMLSVVIDETWDKNKPVNFDRLSKHFIVTLDPGLPMPESDSLKRSRMLGAFSGLGKIRDDAMNGKIDKKQLADLSSKVFREAFGVKNHPKAESLAQHRYLTLTCDDDGALEKIDLLGTGPCNWCEHRFKMDKKCSVPAFASDPLLVLGNMEFYNRNYAKMLEASYCLLDARMAEDHIGRGGYYNCKDIGISFPSKFDSMDYNVTIKKDGWMISQLETPRCSGEVKKTLLDGDLSMLLTYDVYQTGSAPESVNVMFYVDAEVDTVVESKFNISVQERMDLTFDASISTGMSVLFSKYYRQPSQKMPTLNVAFDEESNWENVKFDLILESKDINKIKYTRPPASVKVTPHIRFDPIPDPDGLSGGAIAGIVIGCLVVVAAIGAGVFFFLKNNRDTDANATESP